MFRTERRRSPKTGRPYPWIVRRSAMVNNYYIYAVDLDFGLFFLKFCSYLLFNAKLCLNGPEYAQRQLARELTPSRPSTMAMTSGLAGGCTTCRGCARSALRRTAGAFQAINGPLAAGRQHTSGPRFADPRVHLLSHALVLFRQLAQAFRIAQFFTPTYNRLLRPGLANALSMRHLLTREAQFAG